MLLLTRTLGVWKGEILSTTGCAINVKSTGGGSHCVVSRGGSLSALHPGFLRDVAPRCVAVLPAIEIAKITGVAVLGRWTGNSGEGAPLLGALRFRPSSPSS